MIYQKLIYKNISSIKVINLDVNKRIHLHPSKEDEGKRQLDLVTNPSIGEFSLGTYTMTSRSVSGSNLFDFESKKSRVGHESINDNQDNLVNPENKKNRGSASNIAIASDSINTFQLPKEVNSRLSEKSINPSVTALAGSIKYDLSKFF